MRIAIVPASALRAAGQMNAAFFADPTAGYGLDIARSEKTLAQAVERLTRLRAEQADALLKREALGIHVQED